ncbi:hypothetical protein DPEC_G00344620 [Dallia pectoralis]|uniref:Uncharacterized protein n=1 Tax=Dallia pectoralis TaxID=75939 RepID=A0ACC2F3B8_DALPE|nr:hypothetical protein DPEC_G00344620 [Dallia pectoralis]
MSPRYFPLITVPAVGRARRDASDHTPAPYLIVSDSHLLPPGPPQFPGNTTLARLGPPKPPDRVHTNIFSNAFIPPRTSSAQSHPPPPKPQWPPLYRTLNPSTSFSDKSEVPPSALPPDARKILVSDLANAQTGHYLAEWRTQEGPGDTGRRKRERQIIPM